MVNMFFIMQYKKTNSKLYKNEFEYIKNIDQ